MHDPWNPSPDEIRDWAYTPDAEDPCEDWDLALSWSGHEKALLDCATDEACPNRLRMLRVLYFIVGNAVRSDFSSKPRPIVEGLVARADECSHPSVRLWQRRSYELLRDPSRFEYDAWCSGGFARKEDS
jgi:hypothetical protein